MKIIETLIFLRRVTITPIRNLLLIEERKLNNQYQKRKYGICQRRNDKKQKSHESNVHDPCAANADPILA